MIENNNPQNLINDSVGNILVVDDNTNNLQLLSVFLSKYGYKVSVAISGIKALQSLEKKIPDLILLDIMMPELDGYETLRRIRLQPDLKNTPVIFLTAKGEINDLVKGFNAGAVDYILKPFDNEELLQRIRTHLQLKYSKDLINKYNDELKKLNDTLIEVQNRTIEDAQRILNLNDELIDYQQKLSEQIKIKDKILELFKDDIYQSLKENFIDYSNLRNEITDKKVVDTINMCNHRIKNIIDFIDLLKSKTVNGTIDDISLEQLIDRINF